MEPISPEPKNEGVSYPMHEQRHCCCQGCRRGGWLVRLIRTLVWLVVLCIVLSLAAACFIFGVFGGGHMGSYSVRGVPVKNGFMMQWRSTDEDGTQLFGVITKISGATITIIDNGNMLRTVLSNANTAIYDVDAELSIKDLKIGDRIIATGAMGDRTLTATMIEISSHAK